MSQRRIMSIDPSTFKKMYDYHQSWLTHRTGFRMTLKRCKVVPIDVTGGNFVSAIFTYSDLRDMVFDYTDLKGADFRGCDLRGASFVNADLRNANFRGADITYADFTGADIRFTEGLRADILSQLVPDFVGPSTYGDCRDDVYRERGLQ